MNVTLGNGSFTSQLPSPLPPKNHMLPPPPAPMYQTGTPLQSQPGNFSLVPPSITHMRPPLPPPPAPMHSAIPPSPPIQKDRIAVHTSGQKSTPGVSQLLGVGVRDRVAQLAAVQQTTSIPRTVNDFGNLRSNVAGKAAFLEKIQLATQDLRTRVIRQQIDEVKDSIKTEIERSRSLSTQDAQDLEAVFREANGYCQKLMMSDEEIARRCNGDEEILNEIKNEPLKVFMIPEGMSIQKAYALLYVFCCYKKWREGLIESRTSSTLQNPLMNHFYYFGQYHKMIDMLFPSGTDFAPKYLEQFHYTLPGVEATPGTYLRTLEWGLKILDRTKMNDQAYLQKNFSEYCILGPQNEDEILNPPPFAAAEVPRSQQPPHVPEFVTKFLLQP